MSTCPRCGIRHGDTGRRYVLCPDCASMPYGSAWLRRARIEIAEYATQPCECGQATWGTCGVCARIGIYLNNQRLAVRRQGVAQ